MSIKIYFQRVGDTKEATEKISKWPNETREDEERTMKRPSKPILPSDSEEEDNISRTWSANTKVNEEVTEQHKGKTIRSNALKQETKEAETWPSEPACTEDEPKDECKIRLTCKSRDNSPKTSSKDSLTCSVQTGEIEQETEGFREGGGWLYQFTEDSSKHHINTKEQRSSKTVKDSALRCFSESKKLHNGACLVDDTIEDFGCTNEEPACTKESLVRLAGEKEECTRRRVCETFSQNFSDTKEAARRMREKEDSKDKRGNISQAYNNLYSYRVNENFFGSVDGPNEKTAPSKIRSSKSTCCNNIKEAGRCARKGKEIKGTPCKFNRTYMLRMKMYLIKKVPPDQIVERKIQTTIAGTSAYPDDANKITDMEDEVPVRKNSSFVCVPEVKEGTIKRWLWKANAEANSGGRWVCENFNALAVGPQCACDVQEDAGFAHGNEIPIRKNKSFVCVPEIAEEGVERWTYKNMNASSYSRSCKCHCKYYKSYT
ncbi:hypothetical protein GQX74_010954 [Glossina fuscipes]|nr:hypothetical protein GQX74_010954 [Glossina fuscipes]